MSEPKYKVRPASYQDFDDVMDMVETFCEDSIEVFTGKLNHQSMLKLMEQLYPTSFVLTYEGNVVGVLAGTIGMSPFSSKPVYQEMIWYAKKNHRKYGLKLVKKLEEWCKIKGVRDVMLGYMVGLNDKKMQSLFKRMGYQAMEIHYIKEL